MLTYEELLDKISSLPRSSSDRFRDILWITDTLSVGVAKDTEGRVELFLTSDELRPTLSLVADALEHRVWHRVTGEGLSAYRLQFESAHHFDQVVAFLGAELLRTGATEDVPAAFRETEPLIELALQRSRLSSEFVLGLTGELLVLDALLRNAPADAIQYAADSWQGWGKSARDFIWGPTATGIEVKTTTRSTSTHSVQGVHQVEVGSSDENCPVAENRLFLVSVGLTLAAPGPNSVSVSGLVDRIASFLMVYVNTDSANKFLMRVREYGSDLGRGYDHATMAEDAPYLVTYAVRFFRAYNMGDPGVHVLRSDDIAWREHVDVQSVRFSIRLPDVVTGANPVLGANQIAQAVLNLER